MRSAAIGQVSITAMQAASSSPSRGGTDRVVALPELLTLFIIYYGGQMVLTAAAAAIGFDMKIGLSAFLAGMIALGIVFAAFTSEIFVAALRAVPKGQHEAAAALGLSDRHAFLEVVWPQVFRLALPRLSRGRRTRGRHLRRCELRLVRRQALRALNLT